jgi:hypothetical protein
MVREPSGTDSRTTRTHSCKYNSRPEVAAHPESRVSHQPLPDDIRRFVLTSVPSVPFLEALLLLRTHPEQRWDARTVARRLYVPEHGAEPLLRDLQAAGLAQLGPEGTWQYAPQDPELRATVDRVAEAYATRLVEVTTLIHSRVDRRAMQFADAFRFKKEP